MRNKPLSASKVTVDRAFVQLRINHDLWDNFSEKVKKTLKVKPRQFSEVLLESAISGFMNPKKGK